MTNPEAQRDLAMASGAIQDGIREPDQILLVLARPAILSENLIHAIRRDFPDLRVEQRDDLACAFDDFSLPVSLILVEASLVSAAEAVAAEIIGQHPHAMVAVLARDEHILQRAFPAMLNSPLARSILPMNLRLDIWLAVVRLLLCGGEYFPPRMFRHGEGEKERFSPEGASVPAASNGHLVELTPRELQVLELVSRGLQNKTIAAALELSEHTVKIHLHNIISKLGVHNRTEAADRFRQHSIQGASDLALMRT